MKKIYFLLTLSLFSIKILTAQQWSSAMHLNGMNHADMDQDAAGNIYTSAVITGSPYSTEIKKFDPSGTLVWSKTVDCFINDLAVGNNSLAVGGYFFGNITIDGQPLNAVSSPDGLVIDLNLNGTLKWVKQSAGIENDYITSVAVNNADDVFVTNVSDSVTSFGGMTFTKGIAVCVFSSSGTLSNNFHLNVANPIANSGSLSIDASDNIYLGGTFNDSALTIGGITFVNPDTYYGAYYLAKLNRNGAAAWAQCIGSKYRYSVSNVAVAPNGDFYMATMGTYSDEYLNKYSPAGNLLWSKMFGAHTYSGIQHLNMDANANLYLTGNSWLVADVGTCSVNGTDQFLFTAKADSSGNCIWALAGDAATINSGLKISVRGPKPVVLGLGAVNETVQLGTVSVQGTYFLAYITENLAGVEDMKSIGNLSVFPNPSSGVFSFQTSRNDNINVSIYDCIGNCIFNEMVTATSSIDLRGKAKGIYLVRFSDEDGLIKNERIIIE
jgi:hypothetical protein